MRFAQIVAALAVATLGAVADAGPDTTHTGTLRSARIEMHFRPKSWAAATAERTLDAAERDLVRIERALDAKGPQPIVMYLYDDVAELSAITGTNGNGGFSSGNVVHVPYANDQTRLHEMTHVVAHTLPRSGQEPRNAFYDEGLANAVLEFVDGVHVHAVAAFYLKTEKLPALAELAGGDFYAWQSAHPQFDAYDVGASWFRFLIDRYGVAKAESYYTGTTAKAAFGAEAAGIEQAWREFLAKYPLRPETETLLRSRHGEPGTFEPWVKGLPADILGKPAEWTSLLAGKLTLSDLAKWNREDGVVTGTNATPDWTTCEFGDVEFEDCAVRARIKTAAYCALRLQIGNLNRVLLVGPGTFVFRDEQFVATTASCVMTPLRRDTDFVVVRRGNTLDVWIDGVKVLTSTAVPGAANVAIGVAQGSAQFTEVKVRKLTAAK